MSFITCQFKFETSEAVYYFQCYESWPHFIDIIKDDLDHKFYHAALHHVDKGEIMWNSSSDYVSEEARQFGNRIAKLLVFT